MMADTVSDGPMAERQTTMKVWSCKIGEVTAGALSDASNGSSGGDRHMRDAVERAYRALLGREPVFVFSGWGAELTEAERAVVENREPEFFDTGWQESHLHRVRAELRAGDVLPDWTPEQWTGVLMVKLGQACETLHDSPEIRHGEDQIDREQRQRLAFDQLYAVAAGALDAIEALAGRWAREDTREHGGLSDAE